MKKIDVGHKIRIKETGQEGVVDSIQDNTYRIKDFANGGVIKYIVDFNVNGQPSSTSVNASSETEASENVKSLIPNAEIIKVSGKDNFTESEIESAQKFQIVSPKGYFSRSMQTGKPIFRPNFEFGYTYSRAEAEKILEMLKKDLNTEDLQVVPFGSVDFDDDFAEGGETEGAEETITETVKEEDLELVDAGGGGGGGGGQQPPPQPQMPYIDLDELYNRLDMIKNYKFRVPQLAENLFKYKKKVYIQDIFKIVIAQRFHKTEKYLNNDETVVFSKINKFITKYSNISMTYSYGLSNDYKLLSNHFVGYYVADSFTIKGKKFTSSKWLFGLSIEEAEKIIPYLQNQDLFDGVITFKDLNLIKTVEDKYEENLSGHPPEVQFYLIYESIIAFLDELEEMIVNDKAYEKILLLSMVSNPKLFSFDDFLNEQLDYFLSTLDVLHTSFIDVGQFMYEYSLNDFNYETLIKLLDSFAYPKRPALINIIKKSDGYVFYYCDTSEPLNLKITRKKDLELSEKLLILSTIYDFYLISYKKYRENIIKNLEFLFNLQQESYKDEIRRQDIYYKIKSYEL